MIAGRKLDALVAEKVMGWHSHKISESVVMWWDETRQPMNPPVFKLCPSRREFSPSTSIADAWQVVEKMVSPIPYKGHDFTLCGNGRTWTADFASDDAKNYVADADTAPLAICKAALMAVGVEVDSPK